MDINTITIETPEARGKETNLLGSSDKIAGLGIMEGTGKDGKTSGWLVSVLARRSNGKGKYTALQEIVSGLPVAYAKVWNKYTKLYKSDTDALRLLVDASKELNMPILAREQSLIDKGLPKAVKGDKREKRSPFEKAVDLFDKIDREERIRLFAKLLGFYELTAQEWGIVEGANE